MSSRTFLLVLTTLSLLVFSGCQRRRRPPRQQPAPAAAPTTEPAPAQPAGWTFLGERKVDFRAERDVIPVTASEGTFRRIRIEVKGRAVKIHDMKVTFGNGETVDVPVRFGFKPGSESRAIDLPGKARVIRKVALIYDTVNPGRARGQGGKAHVRLFGHP